MSSYFTLTLDTTGPIIQIYAPSYSSKESNNIITVVGNETLSNFQDIYIIDSQGARHDVTFSFDGVNTFTGSIVFNGFPIGVSTIFAQLQDDVGNFSNIATAHISIIMSSYYSLFRLTMSDESRDIPISINTRNLVTSEIESAKVISDKSRSTKVSTNNRIIAISEIESIEIISEEERQVTLDEKTRLTIVSDTN
jgi:hypothetical protein